MSSGMKPTGLKASDGRVIVVSRVADAGIAMKFALFWSALIGCLLSDVKSNSHPVQRFWEAVQKSDAITLQLDARFGRGACRSTLLVPSIRTACSASLARTGFPRYGTPPKRWPCARPKIIPGLSMDAELRFIEIFEITWNNFCVILGGNNLKKLKSEALQCLRRMMQS